MRAGDEILTVFGAAGVTATLWALADEAPDLALPTKAIWIYAQVALAIGPDPRFTGEASVSLLVQCVLAVDGQWADMEQLLASPEPLFADVVTPWNARLQWQVHGGDLPVFEEPAVAA